jgi:Sulfotransferase domain
MAPSLQVDFIGIGAPKCGTTWLFYALGQHPDICLSEPKEPRYFSRVDYWAPSSPDKDESPAVYHRDSKDIAWYARHYKHCPPHSTKGEFSTDYMYNEQAPCRIHQNFPNVKLLVCVRNPADWAYSWYIARRDFYSTTTLKTFEAQLDQDPGFLYVGYYAKYLKRYLKYFSKNQIKIILLENVIQDPKQTIRDLLEFVGVNPEIEVDLSSVPKNSTRESFFVSPVPMMKWFSSWLIEHDQAVLLRKIRNLGVENMLLRMTTVDRPRKPMNPQTRERLRRLYRDDIDELETLFALDLAAWK